MSVNKIELMKEEEELIEMGRQQQLIDGIKENVSTALVLAAFAALAYSGIDNSEVVADGINSIGKFLTEASPTVILHPINPETVRSSLETFFTIELGGSLVAGLSAARHGLRLIPRD